MPCFRQSARRSRQNAAGPQMAIASIRSSLTAADACTLAKNSFEASFAPAEDKARWGRELDAVFAA